MRTTLDIDDDILQAAKELAKAEKKTAGEVLSALARKALTQTFEPFDASKLEIRDGIPILPSEAVGRGHDATTSEGFVLKNGWHVLPSRGGGVVTTELVKQLELEADLEDAGLMRRERPPGADG